VISKPNLPRPAARANRRLLYPPALLLGLLLGLAPALLAQSNYLVPGHLDAVALLPPQPVAGSEEEAADLNEVRAVFKGRTPAEEARASKDSSLSLFLFAPSVGPMLQPGKLPKTEALFKRVNQDIGKPIDAAKDHFQRKRPYQIDPQLALGNGEPSFGYPSGHSTRGTVEALLMAELFPDKREAVLEIGRNIGWDRVLIGKHFPTDIYAGRVLGQAIVRELLASPAFRRDLAEAKAEVEAARRQ